eukprot:GHUV01017272.1.p1 GENE.GHUV01017272.1~~GHUV01017272.1.p1  ORF type:complete len:553 (+),score=189.00 GHUV01017272.1:136-1794(+)
MDAAPSLPKFEDFVVDTLLKGIKEARRLRAIIDEESEPYKSNYAAADMLQSLEEQTAAYLAAEPGCDDPIKQCIARCQLERGLVLLETDLTADGQKAVEQGLEHNWPATIPSYAILQQGSNALGGLWCGREEFDTSLRYLKAASDLYDKIKALSSSSGNTPADLSAVSANVAAETPELQNQLSRVWEEAFAADAEQVEQQYTTTLYYMAQVYGYAGDKLRSASYCAATLNRQLKEGALDVNDWVQNCLQLSGYFLDGNAFALSQYCCAAVELMLLQWHSKQQQQVSAAAPETSRLQQEQQQEPADGSVEVVNSSNGSTAREKDGQDPHQADRQQPDSTPAADASSRNQQQKNSAKARLQPALQCLDGDVAANVRLAFAKLHLYTLVASHDCYVEQRQVHYSFNSPSDVPEVLRFTALEDLPQLSDLPWGDDALAKAHPDALQLYQQALPWFKEALQYYKLEGWVTEHCHILFEMSNSYRCLAGFESDPHKRCVMHRNRAKLLQDLEGELSPTHYPGLSRSISLELGNIYREIGDIKAAAGRQPDKVRSAFLS